MIATPRQPNPKDEDQKEPKSMRETIGIDLGGDESKLSETPMQAPKEFKTRDFRITPEILEKLGYTKGRAGCEAKIVWH